MALEAFVFHGQFGHDWVPMASFMILVLYNPLCLLYRDFQVLQNSWCNNYTWTLLPMLLWFFSLPATFPDWKASYKMQCSRVTRTLKTFVNALASFLSLPLFRNGTRAVKCSAVMLLVLKRSDKSYRRLTLRDMTMTAYGVLLDRASDSSFLVWSKRAC